MKIAMVSEQASPLAALGGVDAGGQNVQVAQLAKALAAYGHHVTVYTRRDSPALPERVRLAARATVEHVPAGPAKPVGKDDLLVYMDEFGDYLKRRWVEGRPDVAHAHFWMSGLATEVAARAVRTPFVQTFHALGSVQRRHQGAGDTSPDERVLTEAMLGKVADAVIATCADEVSELGRLGVPRHAVSVVPCGVDLRAFSPGGPAARRDRRPRLICVSRMVKRKGIDTVIRALPRIPEARLLVVGGPPRSELDAEPEVGRLRAVAETDGVAQRVDFTGGLGQRAVARLLRSSDLALTVPWYEPFGMAALEAMACGVPVIASAVGGHLDTVVHQTTGLLLPPREPVLLARQARTLLSDSLQRTTLGVAGADRARCRYSWDRIAAETLAVYQRAGGLDGVSSPDGARR